MDEQLYWKFYEVEEQHWWFRARQQIALAVIERLAKVPVGGRILDVGCGTGGTLKFFQQSHDAWGLDASQLAVDLCHKRGLSNVFCEDIGAFAARGERFDLVTLLDVVEHVEEDVNFLRRSAALLKPGGWALITVPAFQWLWSGHDEVNHHKRRYNRKQLIATMQAAGVEPVFVSYFNTLLFPLALAERVTPRKRKPSAGLELPNRFVNRLLAGVFASERHLLGPIRAPFGLSLIALGRVRPTV